MRGPGSADGQLLRQDWQGKVTRQEPLGSILEGLGGVEGHTLFFPTALFSQFSKAINPAWCSGVDESRFLSGTGAGGFSR